MADNFQNMSLQELKELARARIGRGFSKLRTKGALIEALRQASEGAADAHSSGFESKIQDAGSSNAAAVEKAAESTSKKSNEAAPNTGRGKRAKQEQLLLKDSVSEKPKDGKSIRGKSSQAPAKAAAKISAAESHSSAEPTPSALDSMLTLFDLIAIGNRELCDLFQVRQTLRYGLVFDLLRFHFRAGSGHLLTACAHIALSVAIIQNV